MDYFVYILKCKGGPLYTGITDDVARRFALHKAGKGAKYTRAHKPQRIVYTERVADKSAALRREMEIKRLSRAQKLQLVAASRARV